MASCMHVATVEWIVLSLSLHIVHCLLCFRLFLYIFARACLFTIFCVTRFGPQTAAACARRRSDAGACRRYGLDMLPQGPLQDNTTSSEKPEIHNISQRHQKRAAPRPQATRIENSAKSGPAVVRIRSQTDRQADGHAHRNIPPSPTGAE